MKKIYPFLMFFAVVAAAGLLIQGTHSTSGSPGGYTGSPGDGGANCTQCHAGTAIPQFYWITLPALIGGYTPGTQYTVAVYGEHVGALKFGFEATAEDAAGNKTGTFQPDMMGWTQLTNNGKSATHTSLGTTPLADTATAWVFYWTAPDPPVGDITFYAAINGANGNGTNGGDQIYLTSVTVQPVGIPETVKVSPFNLYPNPSEGIIWIELTEHKDSMVRIFDIQGKLLQTLPVTGDQTRLDLSHLQKGLYIINVDGFSQRFLIR
ncbi:MAG: T9SS type A sorting domain-containing protein [Bacteroidales bacterium]|nr:T9SS type A sorting domain-containing protein [Bacteroidales bacterium]